MNEKELLAKKRTQWQRLEALLGSMSATLPKDTTGKQITQFCQLYRSVCSDLATVGRQMVSESVIQYLHNLVAKAHAQLYRFESIKVHGWRRFAFQQIPPQLFRDVCFRIALVTFFLSFFVSMGLGFSNRAYSEAILGQALMDQLDSMYSEAGSYRSGQSNFFLSGFYIQHNVRIALQCFAFGIFFGLGSVFCLLGNGIVLGAAAGYMMTGPYSNEFLSFVMSHGPFELTGIAVAGGAGLKLGYAIVDTGGLTRMESLKRTARASVPMICLASFLILVAAFIEAFWSPLPIPMPFKVGVCLITAWMLFHYIVVLGGRQPVES